MAIACECPLCERKFRVEDAVGGKTISCPECAEPIYVDPADRVVAKDFTKTKNVKGTKSTDSSKPSKKGAEAGAVPQIPPYLWLAAGLALLLIVGLALAGGYWLKSVTDESKVAAEPDIAAKPTTDSAPEAVPAGTGADLSAFVPETAAPEPVPEAEPARVAPSPSLASSGAVDTPEPQSVTAAPMPLEPVAAADPVEAPAVATTRPSPLPLANSESAQAQVASIQQLLKDACYRCHGENGTNEGGMNYIVNLPKIRESLIRPGDSGNSSLVKRIASPDPESVMPPKGENPALTPEQIAAVRKWIDDGAPISAPQDERKFINDDWIVKTVHADLMTVPERSRRFIRYFTLTALYNAGVSDDELETYRLAFSKLINSLSWGRQVIAPHRVDPQGTLLRVDVRDLNWGNEIWEQIVGVNPYPYHPSHELAEQVYEHCASPEPWVRIDWFVFKASRPPLYHQILRIPGTEEELEQVLHVDAKTNIEQEKVVRAGFNRSGVSRNNRLIERHEISSGAYWKSYDFAANTGRQNLFEYPEGPDGPDAFRHDGGELIFTLPNGLLGFMLTDSKGQRLDAGPTAIVSDPSTHDRTVINGLSCFSCHYAGFIQKDDEIRPFLDLNAKAFENSDYLKSIYPGQAALNQHYQSDGAAYLKALATLGITNTSRSGEPISSMSQRFQSELSVRQAAAEFGMTESEFYRCLERRPTLPRSLGALRVAGGTLKRDAFTELYKEAIEQIRSTPEPSEDEVNEVAVAQRKFIEEIPIPNLRPSSLAMSADGSRLLVTSDPNGLVLLDTKSGETIGSAINSRNTAGLTARFSPRGDRFVTSGRDGVIQIWEVAANGHMKAVAEFTGHVPAGGRFAEVQQICISGDGSTVVSVCSNHAVRTWSLATGKPVRVFPEPLKVGVIASWISADGRDVLLADSSGLATFSPRNTRDLKLTPFTVRAPQQGAISPNGKLLAIASFADLWLVNTANGQVVASLKSPSNFFRAVAFSDQGRYILGLSNNQIVGWRVSDQKPVNVPIQAGYGPFSQFAISTQSSLCAWTVSGAAQNVIRLAQVGAPLATSNGSDRAAHRPTRAGHFRAGDKAEILYGSRWTPVTVVNVLSTDRVRIHWDGWSDSFDEDIDVIRIRRPGSTSPGR